MLSKKSDRDRANRAIALLEDRLYKDGSVLLAKSSVKSMLYSLNCECKDRKARFPRQNPFAIRPARL